MQNGPAAAWAARRGWVPPAGSGIAVLASRDGATLRGATVLPLDRRIAHRQAMVGLEVAVTARLVDLLPLPPTAVIVVASGVDLGTVVAEVRHVACRLLELDEAADPGLTVGVACPDPVRPGTAGELCLYNLHLEALPEALVESAAAAWRANLVTGNGNRVLLLQRFAPPKASAVVYASPNRKRPVLINGRWGLTEGELPADVFEVPADGTGVVERLAWKPTANVTARGGTQTVELAERCRNRRSLSRDSVLRLASQAREAAAAVRRPLALDVAMYGDTPLVLRCRPCDVAS